MNRLVKKAAVAIASGSLVFANFMPAALAELTVEISGNGAETTNTVGFTSTTTTTVNQTNTADINNTINVSSDTGNNEAKYNTGGDTSIETGDANVDVNVTNEANANSASVQSCNGCPGDLEVKISGNGYKSDNDLGVALTNVTTVNQTNDADVNNKVNVDADTGYNKASGNTGGDVLVKTGDVNADVEVTNSLNSNSATVNPGSGEGGGLSIWITDNGAETTNTIGLASTSVTTVNQTNDADVDNKVTVDAETGYNEANYNTGGNVTIDTGDVMAADVTVDTMANFNWADIGSCCLLDGLVKIAGNGYKSDNDLGLALASVVAGNQTNDYDCGEYDCNNVTVNPETGYNKASGNTHFDGDPSIETGDTSSSVAVSTSANANGLTIGGDVIDEFPMELPDGFPFEDFNSGFLGWWGFFMGA